MPTSKVKEAILFWIINLPLRSRYFDFKRWRLLRLAGVDIQPCCILGPVDCGAYGQLGQIHIGAHCHIDRRFRVRVSDKVSVTIGADCAIGPNVLIEIAHSNSVVILTYGDSSAR
jgi:acetyltransferase-like isoleucine patch superfamily enzyme